MDLRYPSSIGRDPVEKVRIKLSASLDTVIGQASGFTMLANDKS